MEGQEFLISTIQELVPDVETEDTIKHVSRTTMIQVSNFPAVFAEEEPYDYNQELGSNDIITKKENYNLVIVIKSVNVNEMTEDNFTTVKEKLKTLTDDIIAAILEKIPTYNNIANLRLGRGEVFDGVISSIPVMWNVIPVEILIVA